jgi:LmbE family N-acetylglucosaminyl deacetylase
VHVNFHDDEARLQLPEMLTRGTAPIGSSVSLPCTLLVFAHPDDESIAVGARMLRFWEAYFVHATDGAPPNGEDSRARGFSALAEYRATRARELDQAFHLAGIVHAKRQCFCIPDQTAALHLVQLTNKLCELLETVHPELIVTHPYEGGHPDHDACAFAVQNAVSAIAKYAGPAPLVIEAAFYHACADGLETEGFLPDGNTPEIAYTLSKEEQQQKRELLACFTTQRETLQSFPLDRECFRVAPQYDFESPPHPGRLWYERFSWGMNSQDFCELARQAARQLRECMTA